MDTIKMMRRPDRRGRLRKERGVVLVIALIALVALTLAGFALLRSVDTGNLIAGNMSFRQAALQSSDIGIEAAFIALPAIASDSKNVNIANQYYALRQALDSKDVPSAVNWANVPCRDNSNATVSCDGLDYQVKYVIERLCDEETAGSTTVTDVQDYCVVEIGGGQGGSKGSFSTVFSSADGVYYRVTVQVTGPRNTTSYVQAILVKG